MQTPKDGDFLEIATLEYSFAEIRSVVDAFYTSVQTDPLLSVPFASVHDWPHHVERLTHFWWIRFGGRPYLQGMYNPVEKHFQAGFNQEFLKHWLSLFEATLNRLLTPDKARVWFGLASRMGVALTAKDEFYRQHHAQR